MRECIESESRQHCFFKTFAGATIDLGAPRQHLLRATTHRASKAKVQAACGLSTSKVFAAVRATNHFIPESSKGNACASHTQTLGWGQAVCCCTITPLATPTAFNANNTKHVFFPTILPRLLLVLAVSWVLSEQAMV
eukprot:m.184171 g.184171  ORF g.184171 m.184171 type:complete len:137 (-) comp15391_c0_seq15:62-472(-)